LCHLPAPAQVSPRAAKPVARFVSGCATCLLWKDYPDDPTVQETEVIKSLKSTTSGFCAVALGLSLQSGCSSNRAGPIQSSLTQLTSESRTYSGLVLKQTEFVSLAGLIGVPAPGLIYHLSDESEQTSLFGVSYDTKSFLLIGASASPDQDYVSTVNHLKKQIEAYETQRSELAQVAREHFATRAAMLQKDIQTIPHTFTDLQSRATLLRTDLDTRQARLRDTLQKISDLSARPGIIVAKWRRDRKGAARVEALPFVAANVAESTSLDGYVILGGVRVVVPFFSMDAATMFLDIEEASPGSLHSVGLGLGSTSTYLLQAKEIAYTNSSTSAGLWSIDASASRTTLTNAANAMLELEQVRMQGLWESTRLNLSSGRIGQFEWKTVDLNLSDRWTVPKDQPRYAHDMRERRDVAQRQLVESAWDGPRGTGAPTSDWITVVAQITTASTWAKYYARFYLPRTRGSAGVKETEPRLRGTEVPSLEEEAAGFSK